MDRGVAGTEAYDSSIAWWRFAFAYMGQQAPALDALPNGTIPLWTGEECQAGDEGLPAACA